MSSSVGASRQTVMLAPQWAIDQIAAAQMLPSLDAIIERRTRLLRENLQHLETQLGSIRGARLRWHSPAGGITLWLDLATRSCQEVVQECARLGVLLEPASSYTAGGRDDRHLRLPFTAPPPTLTKVAQVLGQVLPAVRYRPGEPGV